MPWLLGVTHICRKSFIAQIQLDGVKELLELVVLVFTQKLYHAA